MWPTQACVPRNPHSQRHGGYSKSGLQAEAMPHDSIVQVELVQAALHDVPTSLGPVDPTWPPLSITSFPESSQTQSPLISDAHPALLILTCPFSSAALITTAWGLFK